MPDESRTRRCPPSCHVRGRQMECQIIYSTRNRCLSTCRRRHHHHASAPYTIIQPPPRAVHYQPHRRRRSTCKSSTSRRRRHYSVELSRGAHSAQDLGRPLRHTMNTTLLQRRPHCAEQSRSGPREFWMAHLPHRLRVRDDAVLFVDLSGPRARCRATQLNVKMKTNS